MTTLRDQVDQLWLAWSERPDGTAPDAVLDAFAAVNALMDDDGVWFVDCLAATAADAGALERAAARLTCSEYLASLAGAFGTLAAALDADGYPALADVAASMVDQAVDRQEQTAAVVDPVLDVSQWTIPWWVKAGAAAAVAVVVFRR